MSPPSSSSSSSSPDASFKGGRRDGRSNTPVFHQAELVFRWSYLKDVGTRTVLPTQDGGVAHDVTDVYKDSNNFVTTAFGAAAVVCGGSMRLVRKRKIICLVATATVFAVFLLLTQSVVLDYSDTIRVAAAAAAAAAAASTEELHYISTTSQTLCRPARNIAFVKTHKAGSSTIANILQRYGITHDLNFALPNTKLHSYAYNYISKPGQALTKDKVIPHLSGQEYNILFNHAIYNRTAFRLIMPGNTAYITIFRHPFQQFVSAFEYYRVDKILAPFSKDITKAANPVSEYLQNPLKYRKALGFGKFTYVKNKQAEDLGLSEEEFYSPQRLQAYIAQMDKDFALVMIMEYFDESLLLLKNTLCWDIKDVLYIPVNKNKNKPPRNFTEDDYGKHKLFSHLDYALYSHYLKIFQDKVTAQGEDFQSELTNYRTLLQQVKETCSRQTSFQVSETKWYAAFTVTNGDCDLMLMSELTGLDHLYVKAGRISPDQAWIGKDLTAEEFANRKELLLRQLKRQELEESS